MLDDRRFVSAALKLAMEEEEAHHATGTLRSVVEVPSIRDFGAQQINYMIEPELPVGAVISFTGDAGSGKSTIASHLAGRASTEGYPVLVLDRENPIAIVSERFERLGICDGPQFKYWGGWLPDEAPQPGSPIVLEWVNSCNPKPLVIVDSLVAFHGGNENDAGETRHWMQQCRKLADTGATVLVLHHSGKGETSQDYRGSSDFKAAIDAGFNVSNYGSDGLLGTLRLRCFKSRFGFSGELIYHYAGGQFVRDTAIDAPTRTVEAQLYELLRGYPNITTTRFETLAVERGLGRNRARTWLNDGVLAGKIVRQKIGTHGRRYRLAPEDTDAK